MWADFYVSDVKRKGREEGTEEVSPGVHFDSRKERDREGKGVDENDVVRRA